MSDKQFDFKAGEVLLIDKPLEWTSFDAVKKIKFRLPRKTKIGHAGTLDPLATGLLILCTGKMTKQIETYQAQEKEYTGTITLGHTTPSSDLESEFDEEFPIDHITDDLIQETTKQFLGEIDQVPPIFSAISVNGTRAYEKARAGEKIELKSRKITIDAFEITSIDMPNVHFRVVCSKGTYIRSLARDFGEALKSGAHLSALRRTKIGDYSVDDAHDIKEFTDMLDAMRQEEKSEE